MKYNFAFKHGLNQLMQYLSSWLKRSRILLSLSYLYITILPIYVISQQSDAGVRKNRSCQENLDKLVNERYKLWFKSHSVCNQDTYWPEEYWEECTPEQVGMRSDYLRKAVSLLPQFDINSMTIVRYGKIVTDAYVYPFQKGDRHNIYSCTKSFVSALIGLAIKERFITSVNATLTELFPSSTFDRNHPFKKKITLEHLLMMTSGLDTRDNHHYNNEGLVTICQNSDDWVSDILSMSAKYKPGEIFSYSNLSSFLLSSVISEKTGRNALDYAEEKLFKPLKIGDIIWSHNPQGITLGYSELKITPHDMARFGLLYLRKGQWKDQQIIPPCWVNKTITSVDSKYYCQGKSDYGYQWWLQPGQYFAANGFAGQYIYVLPGYDMVVVFTSTTPEHQVTIPLHILENFILKAVKSIQPIAKNRRQYNKLKSQIESVSKPPEIMQKKMSALVDSLDKRKYTIDGDIFIKWFSLDFSKENAELWLTFSSDGQSQYRICVGMDNNYRDNLLQYPASDETKWYAKGEWTGDNELTISIRSMDMILHVQITMNFTGEAIDIRYNDPVMGELITTTATVEK